MQTNDEIIIAVSIRYILSELEIKNITHNDAVDKIMNVIHQAQAERIEEIVEMIHNYESWGDDIYIELESLKSSIKYRYKE